LFTNVLREYQASLTFEPLQILFNSRMCR